MCPRAQGKESSVICMSARSIVTSVLLFCVFLLYSLFGHASRILVLVGVAVDSPVCEPLVDVMDMVVWLSG